MHQVAVQLVELHRVAAQRLVQRGAALDVLLDVEQHVLEADVLLTVGDDVEGLHHRHAGSHHGGDLTAEDRHVARLDRAAGGAEQRLGPFAHGLRVHALAAQLGLDQRGVLGGHVALHALAALVQRHPLVGGQLTDLGPLGAERTRLVCPCFCGCGSRGHAHLPPMVRSRSRRAGRLASHYDSLCHFRRRKPWRLAQVPQRGSPAGRHSLVTRSISVRLVSPCFTLSRAEARRSLTPAALATSAICIALPPCRMIFWISSSIGITW